MTEEFKITPKYIETNIIPLDLDVKEESGSDTVYNINSGASASGSTNIVDSGGGAIVKGFLKSQNFHTGSEGWSINADGSVEFSSGTFRGDITGASGTFTGTLSGVTITGSSIVGGSILIGTSPNQFYTDDTGNSYWGYSVNVIDSYSESNQNAAVDFGDGVTTNIGQSFANTDACVLDSCKFYLKKSGTLTGNITAQIFAHTGTYGTTGKPTGSALATSDAYSANSLTTDYQLTEFTFSGANKITLTATTKYVLVLSYPDATTQTYNLLIGCDTSSPSHGGIACSSQDGATWYVTAGTDLCFYVYNIVKSATILNTGAATFANIAINGGTINGVAVADVSYVTDPTLNIVPTGLTCSATTAVVASDGSVSSQVVLTWTAISTNTFSHYNIRYKKAANTYYTYITSQTNTITIEGLVPNTSYNFGLAAVNKSGVSSAFSSDISQTTATSTTAPATVSSTSATGGIQYVVLEWTHNTDTDLASYNIYRNTSNDSATATLIGNCRTNYFVDGGRTGGTEVFYWIKAVNTSGLISAAFSTVRSATPRNVTSDDVVTLAGSKVLIDGVVYLSNWRKTGDLTKIDGGSISANTITTTQLNFTPVQSSDVIASINSSTEGITIDADNLTISAATTFSAGYDPTDKVADVGGSYDSAASGARVRIFPDANTGIQIIDDATNDVFKAIVGGANVGDVTMGNETIGQYAKWDKSAATFVVNGSSISNNDIYGDGSDGDVTISVDTTLSSDMFYGTLTINSTKVLNTGGYRVFCKTELINNGTIARNGVAGGNGANAAASGGNGGTAGTALSTGSVYGSYAGKAGGNGATGGIPSINTNAQSGTAGENTDKSIGSTGVAGGGGNAGGDVSQGTGPGAASSGGSISGTIYNTIRNSFAAYSLSDIFPSLLPFKPSPGSGSGGGGGAGRNTDNNAYGNGGGGGGSGSSAGIVSVFARKISGTGTIIANGGNGGNGGNGTTASGAGTARYYGGGGGGGGAGNGGVVILVYSTNTMSGGVSVSGGTGGTGGNDGLGVAATSGTDGNDGVSINLIV